MSSKHPDTNYREFNNRNIFKYTTSARMLVMSIDAFDFFDDDGPAPRMKVRCCNYDRQREPGDRVTGAVSSYIPLGQFLVLAHDVESGVLMRKKVQMQSSASTQGRANEYFSHYGGQYAIDGSANGCISRRLTIVDGKGDAAFALLATERPGIVDEKTGLILPQKGCETTQSIFINMPNDSLKEMFIIGRIYAEQFIGMLLKERLESVRRQRISFKNAATRESREEFG